MDGYVVDDPFEWCEKINAFAAAEVRVMLISFMHSLGECITCFSLYVQLRMHILFVTSVF